MKLDLRVRVFDALMKRSGVASIAGKSAAEIAKLRSRPVPRNRLVGKLIGTVAPNVDTVDRRIPTSYDQVPVRIYRPRDAATPAPVVVFFHGGGWVLGNLDQYEPLCSTLAADAGMVVVSVDYRLAPEHPYPAARDDCYDVTRWVAEHADELGVDPERLAVMGDSAGGNLAAVVSLLARDRGAPHIRYQVLVYPATDVTMSSPSIEENAEAPLLTRDDMHAFREHYLGQSDSSDPHVSPLHADDHGSLPAALVITAEHDPLRDDGRRYAEALEKAGVEVRLTDYVGMPHGFLSMPGICRSAPQARAEIAGQLRAHLRS